MEVSVPVALMSFGRFQCVQMPNKLLEQISIIDTPGILTAAKRKLSRGDAPPLLHTHIQMYIPDFVVF